MPLGKDNIAQQLRSLQPGIIIKWSGGTPKTYSRKGDEITLILI
jgi:hypothetical protein